MTEPGKLFQSLIMKIPKSTKSGDVYVLGNEMLTPSGNSFKIVGNWNELFCSSLDVMNGWMDVSFQSLVVIWHARIQLRVPVHVSYPQDKWDTKGMKDTSKYRAPCAMSALSGSTHAK